MIWLVPLLAVIVTTVKGIATYSQNVLTEKLVQRTAADLQKRMFGHLLGPTSRR